MSPQRLRATAVIVWCAAFIATHIPPNGSSLFLSGWDKVAHVGIYSCLAASTALALGLHRRNRIVGFAAVFVGLLVYGVVEETTQLLVGRSCEFGDWLADAGGAALGLGSVWAFSKSRRSRGVAL